MPCYSYSSSIKISPHVNNLPGEQHNCDSNTQLLRCKFDSLTNMPQKNKKFEPMLTRHAKAYRSSGSVVLAENWGVHAKLIYKYQILYLDHITIVVWRHRLNDINLCHSPKSPKKSIKPHILAFKSFKVIEFDAVYDFLLVINSNLGPISQLLRYRDLLAKNCKFCPPHSHLAPSFEVTPFEFMEKLYSS